MIIRRDPVVAGDLRQLFNIVHIVVADVDIEHDRVAVITLAFYQIIELLA